MINVIENEIKETLQHLCDTIEKNAALEIVGKSKDDSDSQYEDITDEDENYEDLEDYDDNYEDNDNNEAVDEQKNVGKEKSREDEPAEKEDLNQKVF
jgi:hypothetical protein